MMTQRALRAYYEERAKLRETALTLDGLRKYGEIPEVAAEIAAMEAAVQAKTAELDARAEEVRATVDAVHDDVCHMLLTLHFCRGLTWKEAGPLCGLSENAAKRRTARAMRGTIPK